MKKSTSNILLQSRAVPHIRPDGRRVLKYELVTNNNGKKVVNTFKYKYQLRWAIEDYLSEETT